MIKEHSEKSSTLSELATFYIGDALCGLDILQVQEVNKLMQMTQVPQSPEYVLGILNLRGQIVTIIDLGKKLGSGKTEITGDTRNIIVNSPDGPVGLLVKKIGDVIQANMNHIEPPPANMGDVQGKYFTGVHETSSSLIGILNLDKVLSTDD